MAGARPAEVRPLTVATHAPLDPAAGHGAGKACATIEARITNAATSKTSVRSERRRVEDEQREEHRGDALRPDPGDESFSGRLIRTPANATTATSGPSCRTIPMTTPATKAASGHALRVSDG
jgi:hypothetical protein